ncbi:hypothetical protein GQ53DRAFT_740753 [Thozetella sp. PMI_491]|nr:hypothetical protein GQ53DRAFT_740753 [Thozetella sp. PMI_491]
MPSFSTSISVPTSVRWDKERPGSESRYLFPQPPRHLVVTWPRDACRLLYYLSFLLAAGPGLPPAVRQVVPLKILLYSQ